MLIFNWIYWHFGADEPKMQVLSESLMIVQFPLNTTSANLVAVASAPRQTHATSLSVLHLINGEHFSGAERVQQLLGKRLPSCGVATDFACLKPGKFVEFCDLAPDSVFSVHMRKRFDLGVVERICNLVRASQYDLLHAHTPRSAMIAARVSQKLGTPWVYHVHSPTARDSSRLWINRINDWVERWSLRNCSKIITVSRSLRRELIKRGISRHRIVCIPNGVPAITPIDLSAKIGSEVWNLGMIALFRPRKGLEVLLDAIRRLPANAPSIHFRIIGGFENEEYRNVMLQLVDQYQLKDRVTFTGFTNDIPKALADLDGMILPSLYGEGMPMVVLEALSAGVPVIATKVEGTPEVVRDGVEGYLAEPRDPQSLMDAIIKFTSSRMKWAAMSEQSVDRHRDRYSDVKMAVSTSEVYRSVVKNHAKPA
ncbi:MAG: glycosyltransferase [Planctomycetota bacterium]|nr:glycosyltransferase [Planctomycetota bacterium]